MQAVAAEMNLAETAFLVPHEDPFKRAYRLRWFTPTTEIALCGHGTLASAHVLWSEGYLRPTELAKFQTLSGLLTCTYAPTGWITMDFPAQVLERADPPANLMGALGAEGEFLGNYGAYGVVIVESAETLRNLTPDYGEIGRMPYRGITVTASSDTSDYDFISRHFAPAVGINEDHVTGSAHCRLTPYWANRLGKTKMTAYQASPRGGVLKVEMANDRVKLGGQAITVIKGNLL